MLKVKEMKLLWQGFILLSVQAHLPQLKPPQCNMLSEDGENCEEAKGLKALIFFVALYLVALGSGCVKPNMIAHGADQFSPQNNPKHSKKLSTYFNAAYFAFSVGELIALTLVVWIQTHSGMDVGFGVSAAVMAMGLISLVGGIFYYRNKPPQGPIFTPILQVVFLLFLPSFFAIFTLCCVVLCTVGREITLHKAFFSYFLLFFCFFCFLVVIISV